MQQVTPFLWFNDNAEEAMNFYTSVFKNAEAGQVVRMGPSEDAKVVTATFRLNGQDFIALNGGPHYTFNEAVSFVISCETQEEIDYYWEKLTEGGTPSRCGWLKDRFGLSWQVVPAQMGRLMGQSDPRKSQQVMQALMGMDKLDISVLEAAAAE